MKVIVLPETVLFPASTAIMHSVNVWKVTPSIVVVGVTAVFAAS
jgi:hypothetical protein